MGSTTWYPKNDNLEGVDTVYGGGSYYNSRDHVGNKWFVQFNAPRPAHVGQISYNYPNEMFICSVDFLQWIYFPRTILTMAGEPSTVNVYASNWNSGPHLVTCHIDSNRPLYPHVFTKSWSSVTESTTAVYTENGDTWVNPQKGSLVFVRKTPLPFNGSPNLG